MTERIINAERVEQLIDVFGSFDANIKQIEAEFGVKVTNRDTELKIQGDVEQVDYAARAIEALLALAAKGEEIDEQKVRYLINLVNTGNEDQVSKIAKDVVCVTAKGRPVKAKTIGQRLSVKPVDAAAAVERLEHELSAAKLRCAQLEESVFAAIAQEQAGKGDVLLFQPPMKPAAPFYSKGL